MRKFKNLLALTLSILLLIAMGPSSFAAKEDNTLISSSIEAAIPSADGQNGIESVLPSTELIDSITSITKTANRSIPGCRTYSVTLTINGSPPQKPLDIVLVIDKSGSMNTVVAEDKTRLYYVKEAAKNFVDKILPPGNTLNKVSLVTYNGPGTEGLYGTDNDAKTEISFTSSADDVKNKIDNINASYGTNTQSGFTMAKSLLASDGSENATRVVILLSDGLASGSKLYGAFNLPNYADELLPGYPKTAKKTEYERYNLYIHSVAAYKAAEALFADTKVFTIGIFQGMSNANKRLAIDIMNLCSNSGSYATTDINAIENIYNEISGRLNISAKNAQVIDTIGSCFSYVPGSAAAKYTDNNNVEHDMLLDATNFNSAFDVITWTPGDIYKKASLTYVVQFDPSLEGGGNFPTNENAILSYKDIYGNQAPQKTFEVPIVYVANKLKVSLTDVMTEIGTPVSLGSGGFVDGQNVMSQITGGDGDGTYSYKWKIAGSNTVISTSINPSVNPEIDTLYQLEITDSNGCIAIAAMWVRPRGSIIIKKLVTGNKTDEYNPEKKFSIFITDGSSHWVVTLKDEETIKISGLKKGEYTITEALPMFYTLVSINDGVNPIPNGKVTICMSSPIKTVTIINNRKKPSHFTDDDGALNTFKMKLIFDNK